MTRSLSRLFDPSRPRCVVLALDGISVGEIGAAADAGLVPTLRGLAAAGGLVPMASSLPAVSSVAWSSFMTASNPGRHGIFGFTHPEPRDYGVHFPSSDDLRMPTLWDRAASDGLRSVVVNLPATYPARRMRGALVAGFVAPRLDRACHPPSLAARLERDGYVVDVDVGLARSDERAFADHVGEVVRRRIVAMDQLLDGESWSLAVVAFTEADRLHHLAHRRIAAGEGVMGEAHRAWFVAVDAFLERLVDRFPDASVLALSDHGFAPLRRYLNVDAWLVEEGHLRFDGTGHVDPSSRAFSMDPGRVYVNGAGAFAQGSVAADDVSRVANEIAAGLTALVDPETGERPIAATVGRRNAYRGGRSRLGPNLVCLAAPGYELKSSRRLPLFSDVVDFEGTHSAADAFFLAARAAPREGATLQDAGATVLAELRLRADDVDGRSLL